MKKYLAANYLGTGFVTLIQLATAPVFAAYLGAEAYGLIGVQVTLTMLASLVDLGLTPTLSRELARLSVTPGGTSSMRSLVRTLQGPYLALALFLVLAMLLAVPYLATTWIHPERLSQTMVEDALSLIAIQIGCQLPLGFYAGGLIGLQRHILLNGINVGGALLRNGGAVLLLEMFSLSAPAFFAWHAASTALHLLAMSAAVWRMLPPGSGRLDSEQMRSVKKYAFGMTGIVALSLLLTQLDKIILSRTLNLADFGYYMLAGTLTMTLSKPVGPLFTTLMPKMTQFSEQKNESQLAVIYQQGTQLASLLIVPISAILILFPHESVLLWTRNAATTRTVAPLVVPLTIGFACNALMYLPYALTLASGWVRFTLFQNLVACAVMIPLTLWASLHHGALGGAWSWAALNLGYVLFSLYFLHRRLLPGEYVRWYSSNLLPAIAATALPVTAYCLLPPDEDIFGIAVRLASALCLSMIFTAFALPHLRRRLLSRTRLHG